MPRNLTRIESTYVKDHNKLKAKTKMLCGDLNCPNISWDMGTVKTCGSERSTQQSSRDIQNVAS